ncbi:MAG: MarR family transcriptional regulator [Bacteroidota bacterium]
MKLEKAIKQSTPFRSSRQRAAVNLIFTHNWLVSHHRNFLKGADITIQQYNVLRILRGQSPNPISTSDIRERMLDRRSDVSRIVDRLLKKDLISRSTCQEDKRLVDVTISQSGLDLLAELDNRGDMLDEIMNSLSDDEVDQLNDLLDKMRNQ